LAHLSATGTAPAIGERGPGASDQFGRLSEASLPQNPAATRRTTSRATGDRAPSPIRGWVATEAEALFRGLPEMDWSTYEWFLRQGVPSPALVYPELPRRASVAFSPDLPIFDFDENGVSVLVFLARDDTGEPADLVAWSYRNQKVAAHFRAVCVLGANDILALRLTIKAALAVHRTPLGWLRAGRDGVVILDSRCATVVLRDFGPFSAEDETHGRELQRIFAAAAPTIFVPERKAA
jgi:hypothetical protein